MTDTTSGALPGLRAGSFTAGARIRHARTPSWIRSSLGPEDPRDPPGTARPHPHRRDPAAAQLL